MEYSTESQEQNYQQQYQQQAAHAPSQVQAYDQSYYAYNQQYPYYNSQYYASSYPQQTQHQFHQEPTSIHPPGVPIAPPPIHMAAPDHTHFQYQQNAYYPEAIVQNQPLQPSNPCSDPGGINPAAVAASSQLTPFAGNMNAAQGAVPPRTGQLAYRGRGRRVARPFRGGGRSHYGYHGTRLDGHGRGRGHGSHGGAGNVPSHGSTAAPPNAALVPEEHPAASVPPSASVPGQAPSWLPPRMAWCELCRVDCNTMEILEQHKNGKRHKKNLQIHEELQKLNKLVTEQQNGQSSNSETKPQVIQPEKIEGSEGKQPSQGSAPSEAVMDDNGTGTEKQSDSVDKSEVSAVNLPEEPKRKSRDHFNSGGHGSRHNIRGGRGGKYMRTNEGHRRLFDPPKPKEVIPFICELCNVKCESQVVFDSHLAGKKHLTNVKRFHDHRALYGETGLQVLYPPNLNAPYGGAAPQAPYPPNFNAPSSSYTAQVQQGINDPQVLLAQLLTFVLSQVQAPGLATGPMPGISATQAPGPASLPSFQIEYHHNPMHGGSQAILESGTKQADMMEPKNPQQLSSAELEAPPVASCNTKEENGALECEKEVNLPPGNLVTASIKDTDSGSGQVLSDAASHKAVPASEFEVAPDQAVQRGPGNNEMGSEPGHQDPTKAM